MGSAGGKLNVSPPDVDADADADAAGGAGAVVEFEDSPPRRELKSNPPALAVALALALDRGAVRVVEAVVVVVAFMVDEDTTTIKSPF